MKKSKKILIVCGAIIIILVILFASGVLTFDVSINRINDKGNTEETQKIETENLLKTDYETTKFQSKYGFTMDYPKSWIVDTSEKMGPIEFISEPSGKAYVSIQTANDPRLKVFSSRAVALIEAEKAFTENKQYNIEKFKWVYEDENNKLNSYAVNGSFKDKDGVEWFFNEIAVFIPDGTEYFYNSTVLAPFADEYVPILNKIILSYWPEKNQAELSRVKIESLPEVKEYEKILAESGKLATIEVEDGGDVWNVHVFEIIKEAGDSSHTASFGWYSVDKKTGAIVKDI
ncbi:MAG: hypothetical protein WDK96_02835 [Candidatus Paceibacterota bacterium]|jgi:hypothetical protein